MKTLIPRLLILLVILSLSYCSNKKRGALLLPLGQAAVADSVLNTQSTPTGSSTTNADSNQTTTTTNPDSNQTNSSSEDTQNTQQDQNTNNPPVLPTVTFTKSSSTVTRDYDYSKEHSVTVQLSSPSSSVVTVSFTASAQTLTAQNGEPLFILPDTTLTFNPSETSKDISITVTSEMLILCEAQGRPHYLTLSLNNPTNANLGNPSNHVITINKNTSCE